MSDSLQLHESQHARPPCPSPTPGVHSDSHPSSQWCHPASDAIQPSHPLSSPSPPAFNLSQHHGLLHESLLRIMWPKYWSFSFNISPSNDYSGLIAFRMDWLHLLAVQGPLKSLLQHHSSKASIVQCSAYFMVQFSYWYITAGNTIPLTKWTFIGKVMSLLLNMLSRLVITFLPRNKSSIVLIGRRSRVIHNTLWETSLVVQCKDA